MRDIREQLSGIFRGLQDRVQRLIKERFVLMCCAIAALALLVILMIMLAGGAGNKTRARPAEPGPERIIIPPEELFLPEEPDFIPGVMLERERRAAWTAEDAAPYWQDPLKDGEEPWRQHIENTIDELMERVQ